MSARIHLCGRLAVEWDGEELGDRLPGRQGRLLFAYLVLHRDRPVRRDELAGAVWADGGTDALLAPPLSRLRRTLGEGRLEGRSELRLVLPGDAWIDWEAAHEGVTRARAAMAREAFADAWGPASAARAIADRGLLPGLEAPWIDALRTELADLRVEALEVLARAGARLGGEELGPAERAARAAVAAAPFRESAYAALIDALVAQGNAAEALVAYEELRVRLREELGTSPGPDLAARHTALLTGSDPVTEHAHKGTVPSENPSAHRPEGVEKGAHEGTVPALPEGTVPSGKGTVPALPEGTVPSGKGTVPSAGDLVEREREVGTLSGLLGEAAAGGGVVVVLEGPAGVGKTRLLSEARRLAGEKGMLTLAGRGGELERDFPFGVVRQLFEAEVRGRPLAGAAEPATAIFGGGGGDHDAGSFAVLHGLFWLTLDLAAERPVLLAVDDLQWVDSASLRFLAYLVRRLEGVPVLVAATLRTGETPTDVALLDEILTDPATTAIRPAPLTGDAVRQVIGRRLKAEPDDAFSRAIHEATGGNPLLLRQLLSALSADGVKPDAQGAQLVSTSGARAISRTVLTRLGRLAPETADVGRAVAILGEAAAIPAVAELARVDEDRAAAAVAALARAEILCDEPPVAFVHPLVRDAVYHELPAVERHRAHARAARLLAQAGAPAEQVGLQLLQVPPSADAWAAERLAEAGAAAARKGAAEGAVAYLERALEEPPPPDRRPALHLETGLIATHVDVVAAERHLRRAYETLEDRVAKGEAAHALVRTLFFIGRPAETVSLARTAVAALPPDQDQLRMAIEAVELHIGFLFDVEDPFDRVPRLIEDEPRGDGFGSKMMLAEVAWQWAATGGPADRCVDMALRALEGGTLIAADPGLLSSGALVVLAMGDRDEAVEQWEAMRREAHRTGSLFITLTIDLWRGWTLLLRGELEEAEELLGLAVEETVRWGSEDAVRVYTDAIFGRMLVDRGRFEDARKALTSTPPTPPGADPTNRLDDALAYLALMEGDPERALAHTDTIAGSGSRMVNPAWLAWRSTRALALHRLGRDEEARAVADEDLVHARAWGAPGGLGRALRTRGEVTQDIALLHESLTTLDGSNAKLELATTLVALGEAEGDGGRGHLVRGHDLALDCGSPPLVARALEALDRIGAPAPAPRPPALTDSERRAAALADQGADTRAIAQALYSTPREAEDLLDRARRKLAAGPA